MSTVAAVTETISQPINFTSRRKSSALSLHSPSSPKDFLYSSPYQSATQIRSPTSSSLLSLSLNTKSAADLLSTSPTSKQRRSSIDVTPRLPSAPSFSAPHLAQLNAFLSKLSPEKVIEWALLTFPGYLYQTTAFGPTGSVIIHMQAQVVKKLNEDMTASGSTKFHQEQQSESPLVSTIPLIFIDTLHHFTETTTLAHDAAAKYNVPLHVFKPEGAETREEFTQKYGEKLWETDPDSYDFLVKSEPSRRAYTHLNAAAVITGRRRTQKGERESIPVVEVESGSGLIKLNPLAYWTYDEVWAYIKEHDIPYNPLHDQGYKSIGDYHSTQPTRAGEGERGGRWRGQEKTECGLHKDYFAMRRKFLEARKADKEKAEKENSSATPA